MIVQRAETDLSPLMHEALDWVIRLTSGAATQADAHAFEAWRARGSDHADAFREAVAFRKTVRAMPMTSDETVRESNVLPFTPRPSAMNRRSMLVGGGAMAASVAGMLAINPPFGLWLSLAELRAGQRTGVAERRTLQPKTGVTVELNARTAMDVSKGGNAIGLVAGEAFISVRADATPVLVKVADAMWSVHGADVNVRASGRETCVTCLNGDVKQADGAVLLSAGQQYASTTGGTGQVMPSDANRQGGWRQGVLLFRNTALAEAVEDINRYREGKIILANNALGNRRVSGIFHTDKIGNAVSQIQQLLDLKTTQLPGDVVIFS